MLRSLRCTFFIVLVCSFVSLAVCQTPQLTPDFNNPDSLFAAAIASSGLGSDDLKPWHLKANYEILDRESKVIATGEFEEWRAAKDK